MTSLTMPPPDPLTPAANQIGGCHRGGRERMAQGWVHSNRYVTVYPDQGRNVQECDSQTEWSLRVDTSPRGGWEIG